MTREEKKSLARKLYLDTSDTQAEIAQRCGVADKTIYNWIKKEEWAKLKAATSATKDNVIANIYLRMEALSTEENHGKYAREIAMLANALDKIDKKPMLHHYAFAFRDFNAFLIEQGQLDLSKTLNDFQNLFIKLKQTDTR